ncbi:TIM21-domain-containing protein [Aspergillus californicus]
MSLVHLRPSAPLRRGLVYSRPLLPRISQNTYATQGDLGRGSAPRRRNVTVLSDDGRYAWGDLSGREKAARATQQSVNFVVVVAGAVLTGGVFYLLYTEVFSPNSGTWQFEKAVERIKNDARCTSILGDRRQIQAYGENTNSRWARNRPIATTVDKDQQGRDHLRMNFHVSGPRNSGVVFVHMVKPLDSNEWVYKLLALEVKGSRIVLEERHDPKVDKELKIFGIRWK